MKNSELLEGAAEVIDQYGWTRGKLGNTIEGFCLSGAMMHFAHSKGWSISFSPAHALGPVLPVKYLFSVARFNDDVLVDGRAAVDILIKGAKYWRDRGK